MTYSSGTSPGYSYSMTYSSGTSPGYSYSMTYSSGTSPGYSYSMTYSSGTSPGCSYSMTYSSGTSPGYSYSMTYSSGTSPGYTDIQTYVITTSSYGTSEDLESILTHGTTVYSTVICTNGAGLHTTAQSDGLTILLEPPSNFNAFVYISSPNLTRYEPQSGYIPSDDLALIWGGFSESAQSPLRYELRVSESGVPGEWNSVGLAKMLTLSDLQLPEGTRHTAEVRAINYAGVPSLPIQHDFKIVSSLPVDTGEFPHYC